MKIREIMEKKVIAINKKTTYEEVARLLYDNNISGMPVLDENGVVVGIVSEKDLFRVMFPFYRSYYEQPVLYTDMEEREKKASEIRRQPAEIFMSRKVFAISPDELIMVAGAEMLAKGISRLPVVENGKVVGVVSRKMIYRAIMKENFKLVN